MSDRKRVWEDFDVDDDPTAFPDPFSSNTQIPISDELQEKRDMFGFRPPEIRKGSGQSLSFNSAAPREASYGQNPESRQNRWQGGSRSAREVSFLVPSQNPIGGSASASSPRHSLNSTGGLLPSAPRVVVSDQDSASASTSSYDGTRNRGFVEPRIGSGGRSSFSVDDDSRPSLNRRLPLTSTIQRPLPPSWRVPDSGTYKGYLFRYKGKWKKQWAKELFTIQHNVVLICPKETPFLIKHCIPLINIIKVDPDSNDSLKFTITYLAPLKKGRSRAEEILCRAETAAECSDWVSQLTNAQRRALLKKNPIADFIERDAAEKTLRSAYRNLRGAGGHILASVAAQVIQINRERNLRDAFTIWRSWAQKDKLKAADKKLAAVETEVKEKTMKLEADLRVAQTHAKKERTMFLAVDRLKNYQRFLLHLSLMRLKRNADAFVTENMAAGAASLMQFNWRKQAEYLAQDLVTYRAKKLKNLITGLRYSRLKDAFHRMRVFGTLSHQTNVYRDQALFALVMQQADAHSMQKRFVFEKWKSYQALAIKQEEGLLRALQIEQRRQLAGIVKLWLINMNKIKTRQATALARMDAAFVKVESRQLSSAFRGLVHYADEQANLDTLQVASNFGVLNSKLVKSFAKLPLHRGCIIFVACVKKAHTVRLAHSFSKLQRNACRKSYYGRAVEVLGSMYNSLEKRHLLLRAFVTIHCHGFRSASLRVMRKAALTQLECLMKSSITSNLCAAFNRWRSTAMLQNVHLEKSRWYANLQGVLARGRMSQMEVFAEKCSYWVAKLTKRRLFIGLRRIQLHCEKCKLVRNMARIYLVQRVVQLIDRLRVARLTQAWDMLRLMFSDTQEYYATKREMALGAIRQSTHTSRIVKRRKELQSRLETLVEDSLSSLNSSKPPELPQFDETRVIPALHKKVKSITYKVKQPLYKKRPHAPPQRIRSRLLKRRGAVLRAPRASQPMIVMPRPHFPTPVLSEGDSSSLFTQDSQQHIPREQLSAAVRRALDEADRYLNSAASQESFRLGHGGGNVPRSAEYILHQVSDLVYESVWVISHERSPRAALLPLFALL
eukprot:Gregarina_sp_Poly_1__10380@NODE_743_length_6482_cov_29_105846_g554_i0_p1_GENE_NODE_743_length_6482_cov_29_105846_g554_i0NODE_743_length_6482_cov_29_105846_g554_i0_p1_ORF_typecomplete_len1066_score147_82PH/PF00169_29/2_4e07PH_13/PF16652_5/0_1_NODE_743_length_6482_cov_29_105846_g554_i0873284